MSKISVVGAGITGLAAACLVAKLPVNIFEASKNMGGVLKDYNFDGYNFFSGCHYFNGESVWFDRMGLSKFFYQFEHHYASYTDIFNKKTFSSFFAGPVFEGQDLKVNFTKGFLLESLADRCDLYPLEISGALKKWFEFIGVDTNATHYSSIEGFQASRLYLSGQVDEIRKLKENIHGVADMIYGLPRSSIGLPVPKASLPRSGFNEVFDNFIPSSSENIRFNIGTAVNCEIKNKRIILKTKSGEFDSDLVIWTADPTKLIYCALGEKLDSQRFYAEVITGFLDVNVTAPFYIQVYSLESRVIRIYLYNIGGLGCFTIEKALDKQPTDEVVVFCQDIIANFLDCNILKVIGRKKNIRFFAYTIRDHKILSRLRSHEVKNLIVPDYLSYGRDQKIDSIYSQLKDINISNI